MAADDSHRLEEDFIEAKNNWELEKLYVDLASAKGKALTPVEKKFLRGLLCGCSPAEIAKIVYQSGSSSTVRVYLSNGLYKYIEEMLSNQVGDSVKVKTWSRVTQLLEKAGYKKGWFHLKPVMSPITVNNNHMELDLLSHKSTLSNNADELIHTNEFHGRGKELAQVQEWIVQERCRLVVILGMGGIGKTAFSVKLREKIKAQFEYVIWRSLRFAPPLELLLDQLIQQLSPASSTNISGLLDNRISQLIDSLRSHRCLIVLDQLDSILGSGDRISTTDTSLKNSAIQMIDNIQYRQGYEDYGELISRIGDLEHQSCVVLTTREKTQEIAALEGIELPVRALKLNGLTQEESIFLLKDKGFVNQSLQSACKILIEQYAGNPLFIKLIATTIQELFDGNITEFIAQETRVFGDIRRIIEQQLNRLSHLEKHLLYWLSLQPNFQSLRELQKNIILPGLSPLLSQRLILEAMELLQRRSLIEKQASGFFLTPILKEYILERLIEENVQLNQEKDNHLFMNHTIFTEQLKKYIRSHHRQTEI
jgi:NB-ARC domain